jgi:hypothetical protein
MSLRLLLARDNEILCEIPLSPSDWRKDELEDELDVFRRGIERLFRTYSALLNENRIRMLRTLIEDQDSTLRFKDFMDMLNLNPKIIREHAMRLSEAGFLESPSRGKYHLSPTGRLLFMAAGPAFLRIFNALVEEFE